MSTSSSEEGSGMAGHYATSSGLESTGSILFSLPSDASDVQTEITPPTSPTASEEKMRTPRDILDASRRLGQISALALQGESDMTPTKLPKQFHHRAPSHFVTNDEAGYDADGDGDGDGDEGARAGAGTTAMMRPVRRPTFLRIDTRQHRRVASMLATRRRPTSPGFGDTDIPHPPARAKLPSIHLLKPTTTTTTTTTTAANALECYELQRRPRAEPIGLGIGFPANHPLRSRAFTMPIPTMSDPELEENEDIQGQGQGWRSEWLPPGLPTRSKTKTKTKTTQAVGGVYAPNPVRLVLRPTFLEVSPSPIEYLPARAGGTGTFRCDDVHDRLEMERERYRALAREGRPQSDLS